MQGSFERNATLMRFIAELESDGALTTFDIDRKAGTMQPTVGGYWAATAGILRNHFSFDFQLTPAIVESAMKAYATFHQLDILDYVAKSPKTESTASRVSELERKVTLLEQQMATVYKGLGL